jgi:hypothetical protein
MVGCYKSCLVQEKVAKVIHVHQITNDVCTVTFDGEKCRLQVEIYTDPFPLEVGDQVHFTVSVSGKLNLDQFQYITRGKIFSQAGKMIKLSCGGLMGILTMKQDVGLGLHEVPYDIESQSVDIGFFKSKK